MEHHLTTGFGARQTGIERGCTASLVNVGKLGYFVIAQAIKLLIVEDSSVLAQSMSDVITEIPEIDVIGVADSEAVALAAIGRRRVDVVLLDLHLREGSGFGVLRALAAMETKPCIVVLTNHHSEQYARDAVALGAQYFLDKARDLDRLPRILREIAHSSDYSTLPTSRLQ